MVALGLHYYVSAQNIELPHLENDIPTSIALDANGDIILAGYTKSFDDVDKLVPQKKHKLRRYKEQQ
jgi:hypothetical protein